MKWSARADKGVVEAVVAASRDPAERSIERFAGLNRRLHGTAYWVRFNLFRLPFHVVAGIRYFIENVHWKHQFSTIHQETSCRSCISTGTLTQLKDTSL
jgi:hypothetical protein